MFCANCGEGITIFDAMNDCHSKSVLLVPQMKCENKELCVIKITSKKSPRCSRSRVCYNSKKIANLVLFSPFFVSDQRDA